MYTTRYEGFCTCPYCGEVQDVRVCGDVWNEEIDCEKCNGKFRYSLEITHDYTCEPIDGEGPEGEEFQPPKFIDPNQINIFQGA